MGKIRSIFPIFLALAIALGGSTFLYKWLQARSLPKDLNPQSNSVPVVVTTEELAWGTKLTKEMLKTVSFLKDSLPAGYISDPAAIEGRIVIMALAKNEPVTQSRLAPDDVTVGGVSAVLATGKRAIAVKGDKVIGISGFIRPGNLVDVLVTIQNPRTKNEVTKLVLEKIPVLATGSEIQENGKGEQSPVDVYTLEVTPEEAEKLALVSAKGKLQFALRNIKDSESVLTKGATIPETLASLLTLEPETEPVKKASRPVPRARRKVLTVEQISGEKVSEKKFDM